MRSITRYATNETRGAGEDQRDALRTAVGARALRDASRAARGSPTARRRRAPPHRGSRTDATRPRRAGPRRRAPTRPAREAPASARSRRPAAPSAASRRCDPPTGSASATFRRCALESKCPDAATSRAKAANGGRNGDGRRLGEAGRRRPAATSPPAPTRSAGRRRRATARGASARSRERRARSQANGAIAPTTAATTASAATCVTSHASAARTAAQHAAATTTPAGGTRVRPADSSSRATRPDAACSGFALARRPHPRRDDEQDAGRQHRAPDEGHAASARYSVRASTIASGDAGRLDDLDHAAPARRIPLAVRDEVDGCRDRGQHEAGVDVASGQQRQRRELGERLARGVRVDRRRSRYAGVQGEEQVERLGVAHLADDEPVGPHAQRFLHEPAQRDLAGALEARLPALQRDEIGRVDGELEGLLDRDDPVVGRARGDQGARAASSCRRASRRRPGCCDLRSSPARAARRPPARAEPVATSLSRSRYAGRNLRMLTDQCRRVMSGITTWRRLPSGSDASTNG